MVKVMIPEAAVEAARAALESTAYAGLMTYREVRHMLEAAAPHMQKCSGRHWVVAPKDDSGW